MSTATETPISAAQVKDLREKTGAPMMDCRSALTEAKGDIEQAVIVLRKKGMASAAKKASRVPPMKAPSEPTSTPAARSACSSRSTARSDFVARTEDFQELMKDIAMHIAATDPRYVRREDVTDEDLAREKDVYRAQAAATGKPAPVVEKIVEGKMSKFYEEVCLLDQPFIKDQTVAIKDMIATKVGKLGENITVRRFARFKVGDTNWTVAQAKPTAEEQA